MNWYRFRIELLAIWSGTALLTLTTLITMMLSTDMTGAFMDHPVWMRPLAENQDVVALGFGLAVGLLWLCHCRIFRHYRTRKAYGER